MMSPFQDCQVLSQVSMNPYGFIEVIVLCMFIVVICNLVYSPFVLLLSGSIMTLLSEHKSKKELQFYDGFSLKVK